MILSMDVTPGQVVDRITILQIQSERLPDRAERYAARKALSALWQTFQMEVPQSPELHHLASRLKAVNEALWRARDEIRYREQIQDDGPDYVSVCREASTQREARHRLIRQLDELIGCDEYELSA